MIQTSVADPHLLYADPDQAKNLSADPGPDAYTVVRYQNIYCLIISSL
jgi:hypothetical protein